MKFAVQLYSLRGMAEREGAEAVLSAVAEAGYDGVEFAGFYGKTPREMKELLARYKLAAYSAHIGAKETEAQLPYINELGIGAVYVPWADKASFDDAARYDEMLGDLRKANGLCAERGVLFGYHNHAHEFEDGKDRLAKLLSDAPYLKSELDVFWATVAGLDPVAYMRGLEGRLSCVHIKEAAKEDPAHTAQPVVGEGAVDMAGVFAEMKRQSIGTAVLEVEQYPCGEAEYLRRSLENMKKLAK